MFAGHDDVAIYGNPYRLFPEQERKMSLSVPLKIKSSHSEAFRCFKAKAYTACVVMCRKTLEGICKEHGSGKNLFRILKKMHNENEIDDRLFEWATALRVSGNEAAHGVDIIFEKQDAVDIMDFTEAIADYLFTYKIKLEEFQGRQQKKLIKKGVAKKSVAKTIIVKKNVAKKKTRNKK